MNNELILSIDIGSTYTKGALFRDTGNRMVLEARESTPTTVHDLAVGFTQVSRLLLPEKLRDTPVEGLGKELAVRWSSSARGGLSIIACGIIPELTARMAKAAALSAGAKVTSCYAYKLNRDDLEAINREKPDILLFAGGTDGGNESFILHNAAMLSSLRPGTVLLYAGNNKLRREVRELLGGRACLFADNVLPKIDQPEPADAREKIREIFLSRIVTGKGLGPLASSLGTEPKPTPLAVLQLVEALVHTGRMDNFILIDLGGATTDIYSAVDEEPFSGSRIRRGLPEPRVKRTVEGDMGMRVSAAAAAAAIGADDELCRYTNMAAGNPAYLPGKNDARECVLDRELAKAICRTALSRHAGTKKRIFTAQGEASLIEGKDLTRVTTIIGSGGYLAGQDRLDVLPPVSRSSEIVGLLPERAIYKRDRDYIIPLIANLAERQPEKAAAYVAAYLNL